MDARGIVIGIDVAAARPSTAVAVRTGRAAQVVEWMEADHRDPAAVKALFAWIERQRPDVVAVDAPQAINRHLLKDSRLRACDADLRHRGLSLYQVPARGAPVPAWIATGFDVFRRLRRLGFEVPNGPVMPGALGAGAVALEVYPYAAFVTLLGGLPPKKLTRAGQHLRVMALRHAGVEWDEYFDHDSLDALAAALTGWRLLQGRATPVGDAREGLIWLPVPPGELRATYAPL